MQLQDAGELLVPAVRRTIAALDLTDKDEGAVILARRLARVIDEHDDQAWALRWIGPHLLDVLEALGATPAGRSRLKGAKPADAGPTRLAQLRHASRHP